MVVVSTIPPYFGACDRLEQPWVVDREMSRVIPFSTNCRRDVAGVGVGREAKRRHFRRMDS